MVRLKIDAVDRNRIHLIVRREDGLYRLAFCLRGRLLARLLRLYLALTLCLPVRSLVAFTLACFAAISPLDIQTRILFDVPALILIVLVRLLGRDPIRLLRALFLLAGAKRNCQCQTQCKCQCNPLSHPFVSPFVLSKQVPAV